MQIQIKYILNHFFQMVARVHVFAIILEHKIAPKKLIYVQDKNKIL